MLRASDADRHSVIAALERHTAAGRLTLDEYSERVARTLHAATFAELAAVTADLPAEQGDPVSPAAPGTDSRALLLAFALAAITVAVLAVLLAVAR